MCELHAVVVGQIKLGAECLIIDYRPLVMCLSNVGPSRYLDEGPPGNSRYYRLHLFYFLKIFISLKKIFFISYHVLVMKTTCSEQTYSLKVG